MRAPRLLALALGALAVQGCVAKAVVGVVTLPVRAASAGVDAATTSQSEADEKRGREIRKREERLGELGRELDKQIDRCGDGDEDACEKVSEIQAEMRALMPSVPAEPDR